MTVREAIQGRRSIRRFADKPVGRDAIEAILAAGMLAPSSKNRQPWRFVVVQGDAKEGMLAAMREGLVREESAPLLPGSRDFLVGAAHSMHIMKAAPVTIFICNPLEAALALPKDAEEGFYHLANAQSVGAAIQNMSLRAVELGLGSLWICDVFFACPELCRWLESEDRLVAALSVGVPAETPHPRPRKAFGDIVTWME